jgi:uncharacterized protein (DUF2147 family)
MKKTKIFLFSTIMLLLSAHGFAQTKKFSPNEIIGQYWSPKKDAKIEIYLKGDHYFGKSIWVANHTRDTKNPDEFLRNREVLGIELLSDFSYNDGCYEDGKIYDPESGKIYSCKMTLKGNNLKVRGYIGISLFGRTEILERIN